MKKNAEKETDNLAWSIYFVLHVAPFRKPGDEGTAMLCNVIEGGRFPVNPLILLGVLGMEIAAARVTVTSDEG